MSMYEQNIIVAISVGVFLFLVTIDVIYLLLTRSTSIEETTRYKLLKNSVFIVVGITCYTTFFQSTLVAWVLIKSINYGSTVNIVLMILSIVILIVFNLLSTTTLLSSIKTYTTSEYDDEKFRNKYGRSKSLYYTSFFVVILMLITSYILEQEYYGIEATGIAIYKDLNLIGNILFISGLISLLLRSELFMSKIDKQLDSLKK